MNEKNHILLKVFWFADLISKFLPLNKVNLSILTALCDLRLILCDYLGIWCLDFFERLYKKDKMHIAQIIFSFCLQNLPQKQSEILIFGKNDLNRKAKSNNLQWIYSVILNVTNLKLPSSGENVTFA